MCEAALCYSAVVIDSNALARLLFDVPGRRRRRRWPSVGAGGARRLPSSLDSRHLSIKEREGLTGFKVGVASPRLEAEAEKVTHILESETTSVGTEEGVGVLQTDLCPPLIIEATLLKESARNANVSDGRERGRERAREKSLFPFPREEALRKKKDQESQSASSTSPP